MGTTQHALAPPPFEVAWLSRSPNPLASHYQRFAVANRCLLTGHSHQAWPDCARAAQLMAWDDAAQWVDDKWVRAFEKAERVRRGYAALLGDRHGYYALAENTHELVIRLISALPITRRNKIVTTDGEFFTLRRQLARLQEEGVEVSWIAAQPVESLAERLAAVTDEGTAAVMVSTVLFRSARIVPGIAALAQKCEQVGAILLLDVYHHLNVAPFSLGDPALAQAYVVGGGYKYCQLGEGNAFLRYPKHCQLRPVVTGWFAQFEQLDAPPDSKVTYSDAASRFAGATYDPTSHYRAAKVFDFFADMSLSVATLRAVSQHQIGLLCDEFDRADLDPRIIARDRGAALSDIAGFLALRAPSAARLVELLRQRGIWADSRGDVLRLGPAPYVSDQQLRDAAAALVDAVAMLG